MLGVDSLVYVFSARSLRRPIWQTRIFSNPWLILAVLGGFVFQILAIYVPFLQRLLRTRPLTGLEWVAVFVQASLVIGIIELVKWWFLKKRRAQRKLAEMIAGRKG
jgi:Ca2+-transporting ATPase